jgi:hypothetical protein
MHIRILDLDGSVQAQSRVREQSVVHSAQDWGPRIRMACSFARFRRFERELASWLSDQEHGQPSITFIGSGDFHHVSLSLIRRLQEPFNLLIIDNHPDWMRGVPFMHCGTWVYHAAHLPFVGRIFHAGGDVDFDNYYQAMAPWRHLQSGKITVLPGIRRFIRKRWSVIANQPLRLATNVPTTRERIKQLLEPFHDELAARPLYISLDKDVMTAQAAVVNWDSGHLTLPEVLSLLRVFLESCAGRLAGMDIVGDWSPVRLRGGLRHAMHLTQHPVLQIDPQQAAHQNQQTNLAFLDAVQHDPCRLVRQVKQFGC